ncbi:MAG TPA: DUF3237 domain-containing protein [Saprospiraceae bacterium]|nr:DUF3237 domain-containing protein [Saprospiraceae bacterium]
MINYPLNSQGTSRRYFISFAGLGLAGLFIDTPYSPAMEIKLEFAFSAEVTLGPPQELGITAHGQRRIIPITGGKFSGPEFNGVVLPGGGDWQIVRQDKVAELDARYTLKADDGALIYISNKGYRHGPVEVLAKISRGEEVDPTQYYFKTAATFETSAEKYQWLTRTIVIAAAERKKDQVRIDFYKVI